MATQGSQVLKVSGILMIIGGALGLLLGLIGLVSAIAAVSIDMGLGGFILILSAIALLGSALQLIAGILGVKNWNNPAKAQTCFIMGIVLIALNIISNVSTIATSGFSATMVSGIVLGLLLPVLYLYGASQLKKMA